MVDVAFVLLCVAVIVLFYVCMNLARRLRSLENLLLAACDAVGGPRNG